MRCRREVFNHLRIVYDKIASERFKNDYLEILKKFDSIAEGELRKTLAKYYSNQRSRDQAWKTCKGKLYEYAVFKYIEQIIRKNEELNKKFSIVMGEDIIRYKDGFVIKNWSEIFPDVDLLIVKENKVEVIISCKTSLRERLTETAFWKRELERFETTRNIKIVLITTNKDDELQQDLNRYILLHVLNCTFITDPQKYEQLINDFKNKYGNRSEFPDLILKVRFIADFEQFLNQL